MLHISVGATAVQTTLDTHLESHAANVINGQYLTTMNTSLLVPEPFYTRALSHILQRNVLVMRLTIEQFSFT